MPSFPTSVISIANSRIVVVVVVVGCHLILLKMSPTILRYMDLPIAPCATHLSALPVMVEVAFVTLGEISHVLLGSIWCG